jgi:hypothetical protein
MKTRIAIDWATYRIYRQCHKPIAAARYAWVVSGG